MPPIKKKQYKSLYFSIIFLLCCIFLLLPLNGSQKKGESFIDGDAYTSIGELWTGSQFDSNNFVSLMKAISGDNNFSVEDMTKIQEMAKTPTTSDVFKRNNGENEIVVTLGGLTWTPTYLSKDKSGNPILTLWLSNSNQLEGKKYASSTFGEKGTAKWNELAVVGNVHSTYSSTLYGTSYMRAVVLNNGGKYWAGPYVLSTEDFSPIHDSIFAPFTFPEQGEEYNDITDFIVKPSNVSWQENGESKKLMTYDLSNENWSTEYPDRGFYQCISSSINPEGYSYYNFAHFKYNDTWKNDFLWLPSLSETGYDDTKTGMWHTSTAQRQNSASPWLRSATYDCSGIYLIEYTGSSYISDNVGRDYYAVRPALHLNLTAAAQHAITKSYNITFNANDEVYGKSGYINNGSTYTQIMSMGSSIEINPKREGYDFLYFTQEKDAPFSTTFTLDDKNMFTLNTEFGANGVSVTLYAQWKIKSYKITFKGNYGTINKKTDYTDTYEYGEKITLKKDVNGDGGKNTFYLYKLGYRFNKFSVGTISNDTFTIPDLGKDQAKVSITAQWIERSYTFEFNAGANTFKDGTGPSSQTLLYSSSLTMPDAQSEGYILAGWYAQNTSGKIYTYKQEVSVKELTQGKENEQTITLYAQWEETWANYAVMPDKLSEYSNEYLVSSPKHLGWIANELQNGETFADCTFRQTKNIDLNDYTWFNGGTFEGQYYGNGYYILNIHSSTNENVAKYDFQGLFAQTYYSVLQNIHILSGNFVGENNVGSIVGYAEDTIIRNCVNHADVSGSDYVGGIVGVKNEADFSSASATISGCVNYGQVTGAASMNYIGGIVGEIINSTIEACYVRANVSGWSGAVGGIAGFTNDSTIISSCAFIGDCSGNGIDGDNSSYVTYCLVDTEWLGNLYLDDENCVVYYYGELQTDEPSDDDPNWTKINNKWFPSGLAWLN